MQKHQPKPEHGPKPRTLVLVRHGQSEWNRLNLFTGWRDPDLTEKGMIEARWAGRVLRDHGLKFDLAFTSKLRRAQNTLDIILDVMGQAGVPIERDARLNERDYGQLSGLNKDEAKQRFGEEMVARWRRSYDIPPPGGESLKDTAARVLPYYETFIWPMVECRQVGDRRRARQLSARADHAARGTDREPRSLPVSWRPQRRLFTNWTRAGLSCGARIS